MTDPTARCWLADRYTKKGECKSTMDGLPSSFTIFKSHRAPKFD